MSTKANTKAKVKTRAKATTMTSTKRKIKKATKAKLNTKVKTRAKAKNQANIRVKSRSKSTSKASAKAKSKANIKARITAKSKTKPKSKTTSKTKSRIKSRAKSSAKNKISFVPKGYHSVTPYLIVAGADNAIEFYKKAFNAKEIMRMPSSDGKIAHAEIMIGDSKIMLADEAPKMHAKGPMSYGGSPVGIHLYMAAVDTVIERAVQAGAKLDRPAMDMFYGDRIGTITDPFGHQWSIATHIEDVSQKEMKKRMENMTKPTMTE